MSYNKAPNSPKYRLIFNDDGTGTLDRSFFLERSPLTPERFLDVAINPLRDTPVDAFFWCIGHDITYIYDTDVGEFYGHNVDKFQSLFMEAYSEAPKVLIQSGHDPLKLVTEAGHDAGMDVYATMRMNDVHSAVPKLRDCLSDFKKENPQFLIGDPYGEGKMSHLALNYAYAPVRQHRLAIISELIEKFDIDGIEFDFMRFPFYFPYDSAHAYRHTMTAFIRQARARIDELTADRNRPFYLGVRVPDTLGLALKIGLDVKTWLDQGLVDLVTVSGGYYSFGTPFSEIGRVAHEHGRSAYACLSGSNSNFGDFNQLRAAAARAWQQEVDGIYLFNYVYMTEQGPSFDEVYSMLNQIGDPEGLSKLNKTYVLDRIFDYTSNKKVAEAHGPAAWDGQVPFRITHADDGIGQTVTFEIGDNIEELNPSEKPKVTLWMRFRELHPKYQLAFRWNGDLLPKESEEIFLNAESTNFYCDFEFPLDPNKVYRGENSLEILLTEEVNVLLPFIVLEGAQVRIVYDEEGK